jgi:hypothetical protein
MRLLQCHSTLKNTATLASASRSKVEAAQTPDIESINAPGQHSILDLTYADPEKGLLDGQPGLQTGINRGVTITFSRWANARVEG